MSFNDYTNFIIQKYRLNTAIAVINTKPEEITTDEYINQLKCKIEAMADDVDDDVTVCSDDFNLDDDLTNISDDILKHFDNDSRFDVVVTNGAENITETQKAIPHTINDDSQRTHYEGTEAQCLPQNTLTIDNNATYCEDNDIEDEIPKYQIDNNTVSQDNNPYDSQKTVLYTVHGFTDYTHVSQSQNNIDIPNKYLYGIGKNEHVHNNNRSVEVIAGTTNLSHIVVNNKANDDTMNDPFQNTQEINILSNNFDELNNLVATFDNTNENDFNNQLNNDNTNPVTNFDIPQSYISTERHKNDNRPTNVMIEINKETTTLLNVSQNTELFPSVPETSEHYNNYIDDTMDYFNNEPNKTIENSAKLTKLQDINAKDISERTNDGEQLIEIEEATEIIPFKILEEFNKVQLYLNRRDRRMSTDGFSSDSGYRSDSQSKSSNRSALQLSGNWLNQSGHSLFNHVMTCHLLVSTRDITDDIAEVLGQLIDKLHEEELYPSFLEELLEASDLLLRQLYEDNDVDNTLLKRDENIQRLILLNKSVHIQKYCIEKITNILTDYHKNINGPDAILEITDINRIENLTYIFHLLEILLRVYNKNKEILSQTSARSDDLMRKSSITDIWKRKWNPNTKDGEVACSVEKKCVLIECSHILNKIIVDCLNSYSLLSYAALKCFNIIQS